MNENLVIPGFPMTGAVPQPVPTEGLTSNPADSQAFQGVLQSVVEAKGEELKAVGVQQSLASILVAGQSVSSDTVESTNPIKTEEKKSERENTDAMLAMSFALAAPPVVFQAIAPQTGVDTEGLNDLAAMDGSPNLGKATVFETASSVKDSMQKLAESVNTEIFNVSPIDKNNSVADLPQKERLPVNDMELRQVEDASNNNTPLADRISVSVTTSDVVNVPFLRESMAVQSQESGLGQNDNLPRDGVNQLKMAVANSQATGMTDKPVVDSSSVNAHIHIEETLDESQPMRVLVESVSVPVNKVANASSTAASATEVLPSVDHP